MFLFNKNIRNIYSLLIYLIPYSIVFGNFYADLNISLIGLLFVIILIINKDYSILKNKFSLIFFLFYLSILISSFTSNNILLSLESSLFYFRYYFYALAIYYGLKYNLFNKKYLLYNFIIIISILLLDGFYQYFSGYNILNYKWDGDRLSSLFGKEKILGSFLSRIMPFIIALIFIQKQNKKLVFISIILFIASDVLIVLSGDRTGAFYLFISCLIIIILIKRFKYIRLVTFIFSIFIVMGMLHYSPVIKDRIITKTFSEIIIKDNPNNSFFDKFNFFTKTHSNYAKVSIKMLKEYPFFGVGPKLFRYECNNKKFLINDEAFCNTHPHNTYLQLLAETGLAGFLIVFFILIWIIKLLFYQFYSLLFYKKYILSDYKICLLVSILISIFPIIPSGSFFNQWLNVLYFLPVGFLLYEIYENKTFNK